MTRPFPTKRDTHVKSASTQNLKLDPAFALTGPVTRRGPLPTAPAAMPGIRRSMIQVTYPACPF